MVNDAFPTRELCEKRRQPANPNGMTSQTATAQDAKSKRRQTPSPLETENSMAPRLSSLSQRLPPKTPETTAKQQDSE